MELKPGYKQTEVGVIPEDWSVGSLQQFWSVIDCKHVTASFASTGYPVASIREVQAKYVNLDNCKYTDKHFFDLLIEGGRQPKEGDLIMSRNATVGEVAQVTKDHPQFAMGQDVCLLQRRDKDLSPTYLQALLQSPIIAEQLAATKVGSTFKRANVEQIRSLRVAMPPSPEQKAIAEKLDCIDDHIYAISALIAKKRNIKQATMQELLTGKRRLPGFEGEWVVKTIAELEKMKLLRLGRGKVISKKDIENKPGDFPIYSSSIHNNGLFGRYGDFMFDEELITWSVDGGGNFFYRPKHKFSVTNVCGFIRVGTSQIYCRFLSAMLQMLHTRKNYDYQTKAHPSVIRKEYEVMLPSLHEQKAITSILQEIDEDLGQLARQHEKTRLLKQAMMHQLLTGKTRLR